MEGYSRNALNDYITSISAQYKKYPELFNILSNIGIYYETDHRDYRTYNIARFLRSVAWANQILDHDAKWQHSLETYNSHTIKQAEMETAVGALRNNKTRLTAELDDLTKNKLDRKDRQQERALRTDSLSIECLQQVAIRKSELNAQWSLDLSSEDFSRELFMLFVEQVRENSNNSSPITLALAAIDAEKTQAAIFQFKYLATQLNYIRQMAYSKEKNKAMWETEARFLKTIFPTEKVISTLLDELISNIEQYEAQLSDYDMHYAEYLNIPKPEELAFDLNKLSAALRHSKSRRGFLAKLNVATASIPLIVTTTTAILGIMAASGLLSASLITSFILPIAIPLLAFTAVLASIALIALTIVSIQTRQVSGAASNLRKSTDEAQSKINQLGFFADSLRATDRKLENKLQLVENFMSMKLENMGASGKLA
jgi:hypothetical protein